jgi:hypothetical protein
MERKRLSVTKRVGAWGSIYIIGGTEADGEVLPDEQADDLIARFDHEQGLFTSCMCCATDAGSPPAAPAHISQPSVHGAHADDQSLRKPAYRVNPPPTISAWPAI